LSCCEAFILCIPLGGINFAADGFQAVCGTDTQMICRNFRVLRGFGLLLARKKRRTQAAKVRKILFAEKRKKKKRLHGGMQQDWKTVVPWVRWEIGF
jgi:hypothetical protein